MKSSQSHQKITLPFVILSVFFAVFYFSLKYSGPYFVENLFASGRYDILNRFTESAVRESLPYYLGRWQETVWGPICQLISGLLFVAFGLRYFKRLSFLPFTAAVFVYLMITKFEVLFFPPYGDAIGGPFAEAIWLARNFFDYVKLFHQDGYIVGGPKVYMFSIYPTVMAVLLKMIPSVKTFLVVNHLAVFAMAAGIAAMLREILKEGFDSKIGFLAACLLISLDSFQSQTEAINMEMPCAFFVMCSAYGMIRGRIRFAGLMAVIAILVKGTAVFVAIAFFPITVIHVLWRREGSFRERIEMLGWAAGLLFLSAFNVFLKFFINDQHVSQGMVKPGIGWDSLNRIYISYIFVISVVLVVGCFAKIRFKLREKDIAPEFRKIFINGNSWMMFAFALAWFILFFNFLAVSPRYRLLVYPFIIFSAVSAVCCWLKDDSWRQWSLTAMIAVALFSSYGFFYQPVTDNDHVMLERSLEYRNDLDVNRKMASYMEEHFETFLIGAPFILAQSLALPELGYVTKKLNIMIYGFDCYYGGIKMFQGVRELDINNTVYVGIKQAPVNNFIPYPVNPRDRVLDILQVGNKSLWIFMGGVSLEALLQGTRLYKLKVLQETYEKERQFRKKASF